MPTPQIVIDTNVLVAGLRSNRGRAFELLSLVGTGAFDIHLSVPLVLEYEEISLRERSRLAISESAVQTVINYHCAAATHHEIFFLWRPFLPDAEDDMLLELAVKAGCQFIVTYNSRDFAGIEQFGSQATTPAEFLKLIGNLP